MPAQTTAERAITALRKVVPSREAKALRCQVETERDALALRLGSIEEAAVDPLTDEARARSLRAEADALQFNLDRLAKLFAALGARVVELEQAEFAAGVGGEYDAAQAERDALAAEIEVRYPALAGELISIAARLRASNDRLLRVNASLPKGRTWLHSAEYIARGLESPSSHPSIITSMKLPAPRDSFYHAYPRPSQPGFAAEIDAMFASAAADDARAHAAVWAPPKDEGVAAMLSAA